MNVNNHSKDGDTSKEGLSTHPNISSSRLLSASDGNGSRNSADQMRQAANRYHQELLKNYPGARYSLSGIGRKSSVSPELGFTRGATVRATTGGIPNRQQPKSAENIKDSSLPFAPDTNAAKISKEEALETSLHKDRLERLSKLPKVPSQEEKKERKDVVENTITPPHLKQDVKAVHSSKNGEKRKEISADQFKPIEKENTNPTVTIPFKENQKVSILFKEHALFGEGVMETDLDAIMNRATTLDEREMPRVTTIDAVCAKESTERKFAFEQPIESSIDEPIESSIDDVETLPADDVFPEPPLTSYSEVESYQNEDSRKCLQRDGEEMHHTENSTVPTSAIVANTSVARAEVSLTNQDSISGSSPRDSTYNRISDINTNAKQDNIDQEKLELVSSMKMKIQELCEQETEIEEEIKLNEELGEKVQNMVENKVTQSEFAKYELFVGELNKIVELLLSLTQRLHRYELMLYELDIVNESDKVTRDSLVAKIEKLRNQHEEATYLSEINDKRGENVGNILEKYLTEEEFADFQYYIDMKSQLALMQSEIGEKVKLGQARLNSLERVGNE